MLRTAKSHDHMDPDASCSNEGGSQQHGNRKAKHMEDNVAKSHLTKQQARSPVHLKGEGLFPALVSSDQTPIMFVRKGTNKTKKNVMRSMQLAERVLSTKVSQVELPKSEKNSGGHSAGIGGAADAYPEEEFKSSVRNQVTTPMGCTAVGGGKSNFDARSKATLGLRDFNVEQSPAAFQEQVQGEELPNKSYQTSRQKQKEQKLPIKMKSSPLKSNKNI